MTDRKRKLFNPKVRFKNKLDITALDKYFYMKMLENLRELKKREQRKK